MKIGTISRHEVVTINREATVAQAAETMRHWLIRREQEQELQKTEDVFQDEFAA